MTMDDFGPPTLNFGKHQGECLVDVPSGYLAWMYENDVVTKSSMIGQWLEENLELIYEAKEADPEMSITDFEGFDNAYRRD